MKYATILAVVLIGTLTIGPGVALATDITGTIASTKTITNNSKLTGDVTCTVATGPCIQFAAPNIELDLNGHTITGLGARNSCPAPVNSQTGIDTNGQNDVSIDGPGIVRRFKGDGIIVSGNNSTVKDVTVLSSCLSGIVVRGSGNEVQESIADLAVLSGTGFAGILISGSGGHAIRDNQCIGAVAGHGIDVFSNNNLIARNNTSGNAGFGILIQVNSTGNEVRRNLSVGNLLFNGDIVDPNAVGANTYKDNGCEGSQVGTPPQNVCEVPDASED